MSRKNHAPGAVPLGNKPRHGPGGVRNIEDEEALKPDDLGTGFNEEDPKRRLGGFEGAGEHARQQPGPLNDG